MFLLADKTVEPGSWKFLCAGIKIIPDHRRNKSHLHAIFSYVCEAQRYFCLRLCERQKSRAGVAKNFRQEIYLWPQECARRSPAWRGHVRKNLAQARFVSSCAPARNRTWNNGLEVRSYIHLTTGAFNNVYTSKKFIKRRERNMAQLHCNCATFDKMRYTLITSRFCWNWKFFSFYVYNTMG